MAAGGAKSWWRPRWGAMVVVMRVCTFMLCVWRPANIVVRLGTHCGAAQYVLTKLVPCDASRRRFGISRRSYTAQE